MLLIIIDLACARVEVENVATILKHFMNDIVPIDDLELIDIFLKLLTYVLIKPKHKVRAQVEAYARN